MACVVDAGGAGAPAYRRAVSARRVLFVTGKLAEPALRRVLAEMAPPFAYDVAVAEDHGRGADDDRWIARVSRGAARHRSGPDSRDCAKATRRRSPTRSASRSRRARRTCARFPCTSAGLPLARDYGAWDIEILAEINNAPRLTRDAVREQAAYFRASGADIIDIGCTPGLSFPGLGDVVRDLVQPACASAWTRSIPAKSATAVAAGAELVLSVNGSNIDVARDWPAPVFGWSWCRISAARSTRSSRASRR